MHTRLPRGMRTVTSRRLCSRAPWMTISSFSKRFSGHRWVSLAAVGVIEQAFAFGRSCGAGRRSAGGEAASRMSRARMKLDPGRAAAARRAPASRDSSSRRSCAPSASLAAAAVVLALLLRSSAPHGVRIALDLPVIALAGRSVFRFARVVWQWDRSLLALTTRRVFVVAPRGRLRRAWEAMPLGAIRATGVQHSFAGRLLGYGTLTLGRRGRRPRRALRLATPSASPTPSSPRARTADAPGRRSRGRLSLSSRPLVRASHDRGRDQAG